MRIDLLKQAAGLAAILGMAASAAWADDEPLTIGDPAPEIRVSDWVKGGPIESFRPDGVYVVEFWATWCGPCRTSIPHLTELQEKYKDKGVEFIGVSVFESDPDEVEPFVEEMGDRMGYNVAKDLIAEDQETGTMAEGWMNAAGENGIPTALIVDDGTIAWIGHPMEMDEPLAMVVAGDWDLKNAADERKQAKAGESALQTLQSKLQSAIDAGDPDAVEAAIDQLVEDFPEMSAQAILMRFDALMAINEPEKAAEAAEAVIESYGESAGAMNYVAWSLVDPERADEPTKQQIDLAIKAAEKASALTDNQDGSILDTLALGLLQGRDDRQGRRNPGEGRLHRQGAGTRRGDDRGDAGPALRFQGRHQEVSGRSGKRSRIPGSGVQIALIRGNPDSVPWPVTWNPEFDSPGSILGVDPGEKTRAEGRKTEDKSKNSDRGSPESGSDRLIWLRIGDCSVFCLLLLLSFLPGSILRMTPADGPSGRSRRRRCSRRRRRGWRSRSPSWRRAGGGPSDGHRRGSSR